MAPSADHLTIHCQAPQALVPFWKEVLGYETRTDNDDTWLHDPTGIRPDIVFGQSEPANKRSWLSFDMMADDADAEVQRLLHLGARPHPWNYPPNADYVVLEDPDGNLFCVIEAGAAAGQ